MPNPNANLLWWEVLEHGAPIMLGRYQRRNTNSAKLRGLGDLSTDIGLPEGTLDLSSPFIWIGGGLLLAYLFFSVPQRTGTRKRRRWTKRSSGSTSGLQTAVLAGGAMAGGYLIGKYSGA